MQRLYETYKDVVAFRIVYIHEAHAADSKRPVKYAKIKGILKAKNYGQRCSTAEMMMQEENITIPCIIDDMDNKVSEAYSAWPDRIFVVRSDGRLAVAADRGPWGFKPALAQIRNWLADLKKTGKEPDLPEQKSDE